jgi:amino acid adenylation domain-containing protein
MERYPISSIQKDRLLHHLDAPDFSADTRKGLRRIPFDGSSTLSALFEEQVRRAPNDVAVTCEQLNVTYCELNTRANELAHLLRSLGVGPEAIVGIRMERSIEVIVALLATHKAGGAYLPVDLTCPRERLAFMLEDASALVLLTQTSLLTDLPPTKARVVCVDSPNQTTSRDTACVEDPPPLTKPDHLAYVIYTSGTTGKPKGTLVTHRNVVRLLSATDSWFRFSELDVWTFFHSFAFDFSVWEIWGALLFGGRLVIVPYLVSRSPEAFYQLVSTEHVTVLNQTPSAFYQLIQAEETVGLKDLALRYVIFGGEALAMRRLRPWYERHRDRPPKLVNMYGITETTVHVTYRPLSQKDLNSGSVVGEPIPDLQVYILDAQNERVAIGGEGEIYVGGPGLARGYLHCPDLTAERFIPDPFGEKPGARLYRTGDLGRFLPGGEIEYLGRIDHQVKIRGFRIELGEIESSLCQHPSVRDAVVLALEEVFGEKGLAAYVVLDEPVATSELRGYLKKRLPEYMVPTVLTILDKMPLTCNGKVDRKALSTHEQQPAPSQDCVPPQTEMELTITRILQEVLLLKQVSAEESFFDLGVHSLLLTRMHRQLCKELERHIPIVSMFEYPSIRSLARHLSQPSNGSNRVSKIQDRAQWQRVALARFQPPVRRVKQA